MQLEWWSVWWSFHVFIHDPNCSCLKTFRDNIKYNMKSKVHPKKKISLLSLKSLPFHFSSSMKQKMTFSRMLMLLFSHTISWWAVKLQKWQNFLKRQFSKWLSESYIPHVLKSNISGRDWNLSCYSLKTTTALKSHLHFHTFKIDWLQDTQQPVSSFIPNLPLHE